MGVDRSLAAQIQEVEYELEMRERVYGRVSDPRARRENEEHMTRMKAVLKTLRWLQKNEARVRAVVEAGVEPGTSVTEPG